MKDLLIDCPDSNDPDAVIAWCEQEMVEYQELIDLVKKNTLLCVCGKRVHHTDANIPRENAGTDPEIECIHCS